MLLISWASRARRAPRGLAGACPRKATPSTGLVLAPCGREALLRGEGAGVGGGPGSAEALLLLLR